MHQGRRLKRISGLLLCHPVNGQTSQLVIHQWQKLFYRSGFPKLNFRKYSRHFTHGTHHNCQAASIPALKACSLTTNHSLARELNARWESD
jgi:hypothetical protein